MARADQVSLKGKVTKALPSATFEVEIMNGQLITCYLSGKIRKNKITILVGDPVEIECSPYSLEIGRITYRY